MKPIYPICEASCKEHYGKPVVIYLKDGGELCGILSRYEDGQIILNEEPGEAVTSRTNKKGKSTKKRTKGKKAASVDASTSAYPFGPSPYYPPYNPYGRRIALDLTLIALLFALI